ILDALLGAVGARDVNAGVGVGDRLAGRGLGQSEYVLSGAGLAEKPLFYHRFAVALRWSARNLEQCPNARPARLRDQVRGDGPVEAQLERAILLEPIARGSVVGPVDQQRLAHHVRL